MTSTKRIALDFLVKTFVPACIAAVGIGLVMLQIVNAIFNEVNALDKAYTRRSADAAVRAMLQRMENVARDNALWDDASRNAYRPLDQGWLYETWGIGTELGLYNMAFVIDDNQHTVFAFANGQKLEQTAPQILGEGIFLLLEKLPDDGRAFATTSALFKAGSDLYAVSTAPILPSSPSLGIPQNRPNHVVFAKLVDQDLLTELGQDHVLEGLTLDAERPLDKDSLGLSSIDGEDIGTLTWTGRRPGDVARLKYKDVITVMFLSILIVMAGLVSISWKNFKDASLRKMRAYEDAIRDELTGLANRRRAKEKLSALVANGTPAPGSVAIIYADLDGFKEVNDTHGHEAGDELLRVIARSFEKIAGPANLVARLGGDEFAIIVEGKNALEQAWRIARSMLSSLSTPVAFDQRSASLGVSIGIVDISGIENNADELLRCADVAMYAAKTGGRNRICAYEAAMDERHNRSRAIAKELRQALDEKTLNVVYQPIVDARTLRIRAVEALVRWPTSAEKPIGPDVFIPVAEEYGLIGELGRYVMETACRQAAAWKDVTVCINVSPLQFKDVNFPEEVERILKDTGMDGRRVELEVTEGSIIENTDRATASISRLHAMQVRVSLDDFGSGFSSIGHLRKLNFDNVKLDRSLVKDVLTSPQALLLLRATITMAEALNLPTTAEGIENQEEIALLRLAGCRQLQGYLFSRPISADAMTARLVADQNSKVA
jgi:diguanylate cyclase (GGDEF)-like protein